MTEERAATVRKSLINSPLSLHKVAFTESPEIANESDVLTVALSKTSNAREDFVEAVSLKLSNLRLKLITGKDNYTDRRQYIIIKEIAEQTINGLYPDVSDKLLPGIIEKTKKELIV